MSVLISHLAKIAAAKQAGAPSFGRLQSTLKGQVPLFHMVNKENAPNFVKNPVVMSGGEAATRNLATSQEGSMGTTREPAMPLNEHVELQGNKAAVPIKPLIQNTVSRSYGSSNEDDVSMGRMLRRNLERNTTAAAGGNVYQQVATPVKMMPQGAGKNWQSISFSTDKPIKRYGSVGMLTSPANIQAGLVTGDRGAEIQAHPEWHADPIGAASHMTLPRATGMPVYDPRKVTREMAVAMKQQGAAPLNRRLRAMLRNLGRNASMGNVMSSDDLENSQ